MRRSPHFLGLCLGFPVCATETAATAQDKSMRERLEGKRQAAYTRQQASV